MSTLHGPTLLLALLFVAVPGIGLTLALFPPRRISLTTRLGIALPLGIAGIGLLGLALALLHALMLPVFLPAYLLGTAGVWWLWLRRDGYRRHLEAFREDIRGDRWLFLALALLLLVMIAIRLTFPPALHMDGLTPLRYWADGVEIADAHGIPDTTLQWGTLLQPTVSKVVLNTFGASGALVLGRGPLQPMGALLFVSFLGVFLGTFALARGLGLRLTALLLPLILFANRLLWNHEFTKELERYRAENWGRVVVIGGLILGVRALRADRFRDRRREALTAGVLLGAAAGIHLVAFAAGVAFLAAYGLARALVTRRLTPLIPTGAAIAAVTIVLGGFILLAPRGDIGFQGASGSDAYREIRARLDLGPDFDPTLFIATGLTEETDYIHVFTPGRMVSSFANHMIGIPRLPGARFILPVVGLAVLGAIYRWGSRDVWTMAIGATLFALALLAVSLSFSYRFDVFVLAQFGARRLFDYALIPSALLGLGLLEIGLRSRRGRTVRIGRWRQPAHLTLATALIVLGAGAMLPTALPPYHRVPVLNDALRGFEWIRRTVPCEGRILADRRTLATFEMLGRRAAVLEGMGPHLRPQVLALAVEDLLRARDFFEDPRTNEGFLRENGVAAVVTTDEVYALGGHVKVGLVDPSELADVPSLRPAALFRGAQLRIFEVVDFEEAWAAELPRVRGRPGYSCDEPTG